MQEDLLRPNLTVFESMLIAAHLKLGDELSNEDKVNAVSKFSLFYKHTSTTLASNFFSLCFCCLRLTKS